MGQNLLAPLPFAPPRMADDARATPSRIYLLPLLLVALTLGLLHFVSERDGDSVAKDSDQDEGKAGEGKIRGRGFDRAVPTRAQLAGRVRDGDGMAIPGALVCAVASLESTETLGRPQPRCATTDGTGRYRLSDLSTDGIELEATARGFLPSRWRATTADARDERQGSVVRLAANELREGVDFTLNPGGALLRGRVVDATGGTVEGAWVRAAHATARSGVEGEFALWTRPGTRSLEVVAAGYVEHRQLAAAPSEAVRIVLMPASELVGRVVRDENSAPVAGAEVRATQGPYEVSAPVYTNAEGEFVISGLAPGRYGVHAAWSGPEGKTQPEAAEAPSQIVLPLLGRNEAVELRLQAADMMRGRIVVAETGEPCSMGGAVLLPTDGGRAHLTRLGPGDDGVFHFPVVDPGSYALRIGCTGHTAHPSAGEYTFPRPSGAHAGTETSVHRVWEGSTLQGRVVDGEGRPLAEVAVRSSPAEPGLVDAAATDMPPPAVVDSRSDDDGRFELRGLMPGRHRIVARPSEFGPQSVDGVEVVVSTGAALAEVELRVPSGAVLRGRTSTASGAPLSGITLGLLGPDGAILQGPGTRGVSDSEGTYVLSNLPGGSYRIVASRSFSLEAADFLSAAGASEADSTGYVVEIEAGEARSLDLVYAELAGEIRGRVVDGDGAPIVDAFVGVTSLSPELPGGAEAERRARMAIVHGVPIVTDLEGRFRIGDLPDGDHLVYAMRRGGGDGFAAPVSTGSQAEIRILDLGRVAGTVVLPAGAKRTRLQLNLVDHARGVEYRETAFGRGGSSTPFAFEAVTAGSYVLELSSEVGSASAQIQLAEGGEVDDLRLEVRGFLHVVGRLVDGETKEPIPGVPVFADRGGADAWSHASETGPDGRFELVRVPAESVALGSGDQGDGLRRYPNPRAKTWRHHRGAGHRTPGRRPGGITVELVHSPLASTRERGGGSADRRR